MPGGEGNHLSEYYMVHGDVWARAGMARLDGLLCLGCLQARLGHPLAGDDLSDCPLNQLGGCNDTPALHALKVAAEVARFRRAARRAW
jgi:hypothetical protein